MMNVGRGIEFLQTSIFYNSNKISDGNYKIVKDRILTKIRTLTWETDLYIYMDPSLIMANSNRAYHRFSWKKTKETMVFINNNNIGLIS